MHRRLGIALALAVAFAAPAGASHARAQPVEAEEEPEASDEPEADTPRPRRPAPAPRLPNKEGEYTGAKPGVRPGQNEGHPQKKPRPGVLSWIGFEATEGGGATVWLQAASSLEVDQRVEGGTLVVQVTGVKRLVRNLRRHVDTRFFANPLARITAKPVSARRARKGRPARQAGVEVRIQFKNPKDAKEASVRTATEADGLNYVYLSFPPMSGSSDTPDTGGE
jgi:hypothetical protein